MDKHIGVKISTGGTKAEGYKYKNDIALSQLYDTVESPIEIQKLEKEKRDEMISICKSNGLSIRQIERLTGISFGVIRRIGGQ